MIFVGYMGQKRFGSDTTSIISEKETDYTTKYTAAQANHRVSDVQTQLSLATVLEWKREGDSLQRKFLHGDSKWMKQ